MKTPRDYTCQTCRYPATNPKAIGEHYKANPGHRPNYQSRKLFKQVVGVMIPKTVVRPRGRPRLEDRPMYRTPQLRSVGSRMLNVTPFDKLNSLVAEFNEEVTKEHATILELEKQLQAHKDELARLQDVLNTLKPTSKVAKAS
jgi:hypothetical protein